MGLTSTDSIKPIGLNWLSYHLLEPYSLKLVLNVFKATVELNVFIIMLKFLKIIWYVPVPVTFLS